MVEKEVKLYMDIKTDFTFKATWKYHVFSCSPQMSAVKSLVDERLQPKLT